MRRDRVGNRAGYAAAQDGHAQSGVGDATDREVQFTRNAANEASTVENRILEAVARPASARLEAKLDAGHHGNWRCHGLARDGLVGCCIAPRAMA